MLTFIMALAVAPHTAGAAPPVPGGCTEQAALNAGTPDCYAVAEFKSARSPAQIYWHIHAFSDASSATTEARNHRWSAVAASHGRSWLYVIGPSSMRINGSKAVRRSGRCGLPAGKPMMVRFWNRTSRRACVLGCILIPVRKAFTSLQANSAWKRRPEGERSRQGALSS